MHAVQDKEVLHDGVDEVLGHRDGWRKECANPEAALPFSLQSAAGLRPSSRMVKWHLSPTDEK